MNAEEGGKQARRPRVDAERNRRRILETAKAVFGEKGAEASLDEIARLAGVGSGTLYRHFPTRDALIYAVYHNEFEQLIEAAGRFSASLPADEALRQWLYAFIDYIATKYGLIASVADGGSAFAQHSGDGLRLAVATLAAKAEAGGELRLGLDALDMLRAIAGVAGNTANPDWRGSARRLVDVLLAGFRTAAGQAS